MSDPAVLLTPASGAPSLTATANGLSRVWLDHCADWVSRYMHPVENMPDYYREFTALLGTAGLLLNCNFTNAQKRDLLVRFTQIGIDHYGNMVNGARWGVNGHCNGRKFPILFAGKVLNDSEMLSVGTTYPLHFLGPDNPGNTIVPFSEDGQTFYVAETSPGVYNWGYGGYNASHVGLPEWANFHANGGSQDIDGDYATWLPPPGRGDSRRCCSANGWVGTTPTMRAMGLHLQQVAEVAVVGAIGDTLRDHPGQRNAHRPQQQQGCEHPVQDLAEQGGLSGPAGHQEAAGLRPI